MYAAKFTNDALADIKGLPKNIKNSLKKQFREKLCQAPEQHSTELSGPLSGWRSFTWRKYRVVFKIYDDIKAIGVVGVGKRLPSSKSDIYRKLEALAAEGKLAERILQSLRRFSPEP